MQLTAFVVQTVNLGEGGQCTLTFRDYLSSCLGLQSVLSRMLRHPNRRLPVE